VAAVLLAVLVGALQAHDFFLKPDQFVVAAGGTLTIPLLNGSFTASENAVERSRFLDLSVVSPTGRVKLDTTAISSRHDTTFLAVSTDSSGTYVVGAATLPQEVSLSATDFNRYLEEEGIHPILDERRRTGSLDRAARERYAKYAKTLIQVGNQRSPSFAAVLGYRAELVPLGNPYVLRPVAELRVRCLLDGTPLTDQEVIIGGADDSGRAFPERVLRSDGNGLVTVRLDQLGKWYLKFVHMVPGRAPGVDYESSWATLTFELPERR
jgi:uncharacterized GH25 family protein